jgi:hypothetical protein
MALDDLPSASARRVPIRLFVCARRVVTEPVTFARCEASLRLDAPRAREDKHRLGSDEWGARWARWEFPGIEAEGTTATIPANPAQARRKARRKAGS